MNIKTIILARGGSKGIPNKNIVSIKNKPLVSYAVLAAQKSMANDVWVSSNDHKILDIAKNYGASIILRPDNISQDSSKSEEALIHFANNIDFDILVFIQPTSPLILAEDIDRGLSMMKSHDSVFSAYKEHWIPRWKMDGTTDDWNTSDRPMRQDIPEKFVENGAIYITTRQSLLSSKLRYGGKIGILEMPISRSFQVDTYDDLDLIEKLI